MIECAAANTEKITTDSSWTPPSTNATVCFWWYKTATPTGVDYLWHHDQGNYMKLNGGDAIEVALIRASNKDIYYNHPFANDVLYHVAYTSYPSGSKQAMDL